MQIFGRARALGFGLLVLIGFAECNRGWPFLSPTPQMSSKRLSTIATLEIPAGFPTDLQAPLAAALQGEAREPRAFTLQLDGARGAPVLAQLESTSGKLWMIRGVEPQEPGSTVEFSVTPNAVEPILRITQQPGGYLVSELGRPILFYQTAPKAHNGLHERTNYAHPVHGLDGEILTQDFPEDHPHHRGSSGPGIDSW